MESLRFNTMILRQQLLYTRKYEVVMRDIYLVYALTHLNLGRAPPFSSSTINLHICTLYRVHNLTSIPCRSSYLKSQVYLLHTTLNRTHFEVLLSIPWNTFYTLLPTPVQTSSRQYSYDISRKTKALIVRQDHIYAMADLNSCSTHQHAVFCREPPRLLWGKERECASALITAPHEANHFCSNYSKPAECDLSPLLSFDENLHYFMGGCDFKMKLITHSQLSFSTTQPLLFNKTEGMNIEINSTLIHKHQPYMESKATIILNNTKLIPYIIAPLSENFTTLYNNHLSTMPNFTVWQQQDAKLQEEISQKLQIAKHKKTLQVNSLQSNTNISSSIILYVLTFTSGILQLFSLGWNVLLHQRLTALHTVVAAMNLLTSEFCQDPSRVVTTALTPTTMCPLQFKLTSFQPRTIKTPLQLKKSMPSLHADCATTIRKCNCYSRSKSRLYDYYFHTNHTILIPEEITICSFPNKIVVPAPTTILQITTNKCKVQYISNRGFTMISRGSTHCCLFRILGVDLWLRTPACTLSKTLTCITNSTSHITAAYDKPILCNSRHLHVTIAQKKKTPTTPPAKVTSPMSAGTTLTIVFAVIITIPCALIGYSFVTSLLPNHYFPAEFPCTIRRMLQSHTVPLTSVKATYHLHVPRTLTVHQHKIWYSPTPLPMFIVPTNQETLHYIIPELNTTVPLYVGNSNGIVPVRTMIHNLTQTEDYQALLVPTIVQPTSNVYPSLSTVTDFVTPQSTSRPQHNTPEMESAIT